MKDETSVFDRISPDNISGFVVGEGCFYVEFGNDGKYRQKIRVRPTFVIELAIDDREILEQIQLIIGCGQIYEVHFGRYQAYAKKNWKEHVKYKVSNITDISQKVIPFFNRYPLFGKKRRAFDAFSLIAQKVFNKEHLTKHGLQEIEVLVSQLRTINRRGKRQH
jgi:hypothetical protein